MNGTYFYTRKILARYGVGKALQFWAYTQVYPKTFAKWFEFVDTVPQPAGADADFRLRLVMRAGFRFINPRLSVPQVTGALINHYTIIKKSFSPVGLDRFMAGCQLAEVTGQSGKKYVFKVRHDISKEGALSIVFMVVDGEVYTILATLAGALSEGSDGRPVFMVGMLRGPGIQMRDGKQVSDGKQMVVDSTRDLNGMRPKQAVVHAASALAQWFGASEIIAPNTEDQIAIRNWFKGRKIHADHDSFWQEFAKEPAQAGGYHLPLPLPRRNLADVQQKRRKDWTLRYGRIDRFLAEIKTALDTLKER